MTIEAKVIADSIADGCKRITTMQLRYPRFIHAEFMTHRVFSRNASSSRAIPIERMIEDIKRDPALPVRWGINGRGMQDHGEMRISDQEWCQDVWLNARDEAIKQVEMYLRSPIQPHKQIVNRLLEPWMHINVLVTSTDWNNFFHLRCHKDAQPEIKVLADRMYEAMQGSTPELKKIGEWHLPYITEDDKFEADAWLTFNGPDLSEEEHKWEYYQVVLKMSTARCARVSYLTHEMKKPSIEADLKLYDRLMGSQPVHASPAEHQATPDHLTLRYSGNFLTWSQHRKFLEGENLELKEYKTDE